ncbi:hypothetical protein [Pantoea sp.]|uniref:hypothetical protein n=1 Tax=Pantoea sp. TaxID=69393 RepID=UPI00289EF412|nr:hypothetical protein [Pantoea sp.]
MLVRKFSLLLSVALSCSFVDIAFAGATTYTDEQIKQFIIDAATAAYPGSVQHRKKWQ